MTSNNLDVLEQDVRSLLAEATADLSLHRDLAGPAWKRGRRRHHVAVATGVAAGSVAVIAVAAVAVAVASEATRGAHHTGGASVAASPTPKAVAPGPVCVASTSPWATNDPGLAKVCLTAPVDGYQWDSRPAGDLAPASFIAGQGSHLTRSWSLRQSPDTRTTGPSGIVNVAPTGPEITVIVARAGAFPTQRSEVSAAHLLTVIGTTTVRGTTATIARDSDNARHLLLTIDGFNVEVTGGNYSDPASPPSVSTLTDVVNGLRNL